MTTSSHTKATQGTVYALIDPRDGTTRYIGQTTRPLPTRLSGHISNPAACIASWVTELKAASLRPAIAPLHQDVPTSILLRLEREEITRRLIEGEKILNAGSTGDARKALLELEETKRKARVRAAWEEAAHRTRAALGGPLPPGNIPLIPFPETVWRHMPELWNATDAVNETDDGQYIPFDEALWGVRHKVREAEKHLQSQLWASVRGGWGTTRGKDDTFDERLESMVKATVGIRCDSREDAALLVTLAPWCIIALAPWAALAKRAELSLDPDDFIAWVTDRPEVEDALRFVFRHHPRMLEDLASLLEHYNHRMNPSVHLVACAAAHTPFDLSDEITDTVTRTLRDIARDQMLTPQMAELLARLDPRALDDVFGRDLAGAADVDLNLPAGTSAAVIAHLAKSLYNSRELERVLARATGTLPSKAYPSYSTWHGDGVCLLQGMIEALCASGLATGTGCPTPAEAEANARALWACDLERASRHARS